MFFFFGFLLLALPVFYSRKDKDKRGALFVICWWIGIALMFFALGYAPF